MADPRTSYDALLTELRDIALTPRGDYVSSGIHESQSRMWEKARELYGV